MRGFQYVLSVAIVGGLAWASPAGATTMTFSNPAPISLPGGDPNLAGPAVPYPSSIVVAGFSGLTTKVTATFKDLSHTWPDDLDFMLEGPGGVRVMLMSDAGFDFDLTGFTLTFDDAAASPLPDATAISAGTYQPTDHAPVGFPEIFPPGGANATALSAYNGLNPNGLWNLWAFDDEDLDFGVMAGGWELTITDNAPAVPEPASLLLVATGAAALMGRRRRLGHVAR
jgi:hypothetical protein